MEINKKYKPTYHASVPFGWANDPNGLIYYKGQAHFFFQHYPHAPKWGIMHWGHFVSDDFIKWKVMPIALYPDQQYEEECGCCSGTAIEVNDRLYLMYTAAQITRQRQCLAYSDDGLHFDKVDLNPIMSAEKLSDEISPKDFRDPKVFYKDGTYYCIAGTRILSKDDYDKVTSLSQPHGGEVDINDVAGGDLYTSSYGNLVLLKSDNLLHWHYCGKLIYPQDNIDEAFLSLNGVYECPDFVEVDGHQIVLASPQHLPQMGNKYENLHSGIYMEGELDYTTGHFTIHDIDEIDSGFDFYAAQVMSLPDGRKIMIAWKEMWNRTYPTESDRWIGTYTLPRELHFHDGHLYQTPVTEIKKYRQNKMTHTDITVNNSSVKMTGITGNKIEIVASIDVGNAKKTGFRLFKSEDDETFVYYDAEEKCLVFDRSASGVEIGGFEKDVNIRRRDFELDDNILKLQMFLDVSCLEIFINDGRYTMTGNIYGEPEIDTGVEFFSYEGEATLLSITKYDIVVE